jgi:hypothetical protein
MVPAILGLVVLIVGYCAFRRLSSIGVALLMSGCCAVIALMISIDAISVLPSVIAGLPAILDPDQLSMAATACVSLIFLSVASAFGVLGRVDKQDSQII